MKKYLLILLPLFLLVPTLSFGETMMPTVTVTCSSSPGTAQTCTTNNQFWTIDAGQQGAIYPGTYKFVNAIIEIKPMDTATYVDQKDREIYLININQDIKVTGTHWQRLPLGGLLKCSYNALNCTYKVISTAAE